MVAERYAQETRIDFPFGVAIHYSDNISVCRRLDLEHGKLELIVIEVQVPRTIRLSPDTVESLAIQKQTNTTSSQNLISLVIIM